MEISYDKSNLAWSLVDRFVEDSDQDFQVQPG